MVLILEYKHMWVILRNPVESWQYEMRTLHLVGLWTWNIFTIYPVYMEICYHLRTLMLAWVVLMLEYKHMWVILRNPIKRWHYRVITLHLVGLLDLQYFHHLVTYIQCT